jgi:hypothetical protein
MTISITLASPRKPYPKALFSDAHRWCQARIAAYRTRREQRRSLALLLALRERNPRLFEEIRIDAADLPPPQLGSLSLLPPVVISQYMLGADRLQDHW